MTQYLDVQEYADTIRGRRGFYLDAWGSVKNASAVHHVTNEEAKPDGIAVCGSKNYKPGAWDTLVILPNANRYLSKHDANRKPPVTCKLCLRQLKKEAEAQGHSFFTKI